MAVHPVAAGRGSALGTGRAWRLGSGQELRAPACWDHPCPGYARSCVERNDADFTERMPTANLSEGQRRRSARRQEHRRFVSHVAAASVRARRQDTPNRPAGGFTLGRFDETRAASRRLRRLRSSRGNPPAIVEQIVEPADPITPRLLAGFENGLRSCRECLPEGRVHICHVHEAHAGARPGTG